MELSTLNSLLWNERQLLELLLFKLEEEQLLLAAGKSRWLSHATREVENVLEQIRGAELAREVETSHIAMELGLQPHATLLDISEQAEEPWNELLSSHRQALLQLVSEIDATSTGNKELLTTAQRAISETIAHYQRNEKTYDHTGATRTSDAPAQLFDQSL